MTARALVAPALTLALVAGLATSAQAQTYPSRTGLWASAHQSTMNGRKLPGKLDVKGAMAPAERQAIVQAMQALGLPAGWSPGLACQAKPQVDVADTLREARDQGCQVQLTEQRADAVRFALHCNRPDGALKGQGEVSGIGSTEVRTRYAMTGRMQGQPLTMESQSVSKWVGADCANPPAGISASWIEK